MRSVNPETRQPDQEDPQSVKADREMEGVARRKVSMLTAGNGSSNFATSNGIDDLVAKGRAAASLAQSELKSSSHELKEAIKSWQQFPWSLADATTAYNMQSGDAFLPNVSSQLKVAKKKRGLAGFVNGTRRSAMPDTGTSQNVVSAAFAVNEGLIISGAPITLKLGNSVTTKSLGTVSFQWAFAERPKEITSIICHVLSDCIYDIILGSNFLIATETLSKYRRRITECFFSVASVFHFGFLGNSRQRLRGGLQGMADVLAVPDTGTEGNVMDWNYALEKGFKIVSGPKYQQILQFADGSCARTAGQVFTKWIFESGEEVPVTFEILMGCCSEVIIGEDILYDYNVFENHASSIVMMETVADDYDLAPFDFVRRRNRWYFDMVDKLNGQKVHETSNGDGISHTDSLKNMELEERSLRDQWNYTYDFGKTASTLERELENVRREKFADRSARAHAQARVARSNPTIPQNRHRPSDETCLSQSAVTFPDGRSPGGRALPTAKPCAASAGAVNRWLCKLRWWK